VAVLSTLIRFRRREGFLFDPGERILCTGAKRFIKVKREVELPIRITDKNFQ